MRKWFKPLWQGVRLCWLLMVAALALAGQAVDNGDSLVAQGIALREQGDLQKSIDLLSSASKLAVSPGGQVRARGELGISLLQAHRYEESEGLLREAYASSTGVERAHFAVYLGNLALIRKRSEEARGYYQEALGLAPEAIEIQFSVRLNLLRMAPEPEKLAQLLLLSQQIDQAGGPPGPLALNGAVAHAFADILFKGLLFMSMGAVLFRTGTTKANELGGLYRSMPWTTLFCLVGAISISAMPLFSAFVTKSMILSSVAATGMVVVWLMLMFASAGVLEHSGIKIPYFAFFGHDSGKRVKEAPFNMLLAMGMASFLCIAIGLPAFLPGFGYEWLYSLLPYPIEAASYQPFTVGHILAQLQLLALAVFAFVLLQRLGLYPPEKPGVILDSDWIYRKVGYGIVRWVDTVWAKLGPAMTHVFRSLTERTYDRMINAFSPRGALARNGTAAGMTIWTTVILALVLLISYLTS
jgi:hypothetical protein